MKIGCIVAILAIFLLVGCAQTTPPAIPSTPATTVPAVTIPAVTTTVEEKPAASEIGILVKGFDPEELTVKKGTTVKWINTAPANKIITVNGKSSGTLKSGDMYEYTFAEAGTYNIFDLFGKKTGKVIVTE